MPKPLMVKIKRRSLMARLKRRLRAYGQTVRPDRHHPGQWLIIDIRRGTLVETGTLQDLGTKHAALAKFERLAED
jgi:hypothetical protein